jgi:adenosylhomocysteine nucleosidase
MPMSSTVIVAALEREVRPFIKRWRRIRREHQGRSFTFFDRAGTTLVCGGIGAQAARRAAEAAIALYCPVLIKSVGFAGALDPSLHVGDIFLPSLVVDARDGSRIQIAGGEGTLVTFMEVAGAAQKSKLAQAYAARAVDMEAAVVAASASAHGIAFAAIKVISDELDFEIPGMAAFINANGELQTARFVLFAVLRPWLWSRIRALALNSGKAARVLARYLELDQTRPTAVAASVSPASAPTGGHS